MKLKLKEVHLESSIYTTSVVILRPLAKASPLLAPGLHALFAEKCCAAACWGVPRDVSWIIAPNMFLKAALKLLSLAPINPFQLVVHLEWEQVSRAYFLVAVTGLPWSTYSE